MTEFNFYLPNGVVYVEDSKDTLSNKHYFNPGASITTRVFQPNVVSIDAFRHHQESKEEQFKEFAHEFGGRFRATVEVGENKTAVSLEKKLLEHKGFFQENGEKGLDHVACSVHDGLRARFFVSKRTQLAAMANRLTPSQNRNVVDVKDGFMTLNKIGIPRYKVIYNFHGFNVELVVLHQGMEEALKRTDRAHKQQRARQSALGGNAVVQTDWKLAAKFSREAAAYERERIKVHAQEREKLRLDRFAVSNLERHFYFHPKDGVFYTQPDPYENGRPVKALSPDFERGMYVIDNGKTDSISGAKEIPKQEFLDITIGAYSDYVEQKALMSSGVMRQPTAQ